MYPDACEKEMDKLMTSALDGHFVRISIGETDLWVKAAAKMETRRSGLAGQEDLPFDGMLFVYQGDHDAAFTLAGMLFPINVYFFDSKGERVYLFDYNEEGEVDVVQSPEKYRYVVETKSDLVLDGDLQLHEIRAELNVSSDESSSA